MIRRAKGKMEVKDREGEGRESRAEEDYVRKGGDHEVLPGDGMKYYIYRRTANGRSPRTVNISPSESPFLHLHHHSLHSTLLATQALHPPSLYHFTPHLSSSSFHFSSSPFRPLLVTPHYTPSSPPVTTRTQHTSLP